MVGRCHQFQGGALPQAPTNLCPTNRLANCKPSEAFESANDSESSCVTPMRRYAPLRQGALSPVVPLNAVWKPARTWTFARDKPSLARGSASTESTKSDCVQKDRNLIEANGDDRALVELVRSLRWRHRSNSPICVICSRLREVIASKRCAKPGSLKLATCRSCRARK